MSFVNMAQGCSFVRCAVCNGEFLESDTVACAHPDAPPAWVCSRCSAEHTQFELEVMFVEAWKDARMSDNYFCSDCGVVVVDGSGYCDACFRRDLAEEVFGAEEAFIDIGGPDGDL